MGLFDRLFGNAATLEKAVAGYPTFAFPNKGIGHFLDITARKANLDYFSEVKHQRIALIRELLDDFGFTLPDPTASEHGVAVSTALDGFARSTLAPLKGIEDICAYGWRERPSDGREARILSIAVDLGIYCGECTTQTPPGFAWTVDNSRYRTDDYMPTSGNVCISKVVAAQPKHFEKFLDVLDFAVRSVGQLGRARNGKTIVRSNMFDFLDAIMGGGHG
jgi:hypothetical protein